MGCTPAGRGLKICSQGQWLQSQKESQNFYPWPSTIPSTRFLEASLREKGANLSPLPLRVGWGRAGVLGHSCGYSML